VQPLAPRLPFSMAVGAALMLSMAADPLAFKGPVTAALVLGAVLLVSHRTLIRRPQRGP
jgi:hypothetical protein